MKVAHVPIERTTARLERILREHPFLMAYLAAAVVAWAIVLGIR